MLDSSKSAMATAESKENDSASPLESEHLQLLSIAAGAPSCLSPTIIPAELNGINGIKRPNYRPK